MSIVNDALKKIEAKQGSIHPKEIVFDNKQKEKKETYGPEPVIKKQNKASYWLMAVIGGFFLLVVSIASSRVGSDRAPLRSGDIAKKNTARDPAIKLSALFEPRQQNAEFELTGIMYSEYEPAAIINNRVVKIGDVIGEATVESIEESLVKLSRQDEVIILQVQ